MIVEQRAFSDVRSLRQLEVTEQAATTFPLSGPMLVDLTMYRGDTGKFRITVKNEDNSPADLGGATWDADIRNTANSAVIITSFDIVPVAGDSSSVDVVLPADKADQLVAGPLVYDVEMRLGDEVLTLISGKITVTQDVSRP